MQALCAPNDAALQRQAWRTLLPFVVQICFFHDAAERLGEWQWHWFACLCVSSSSHLTPLAGASLRTRTLDRSSHSGQQSAPHRERSRGPRRDGVRGSCRAHRHPAVARCACASASASASANWHSATRASARRLCGQLAPAAAARPPARRRRSLRRLQGTTPRTLSLSPISLFSFVPTGDLQTLRFIFIGLTIGKGLDKGKVIKIGNYFVYKRFLQIFFQIFLNFQQGYAKLNPIFLKIFCKTNFFVNFCLVFTLQCERRRFINS